MKKNLFALVLSLALAVSMALPAGAKKDEGAEVRWLDIELPEAVLNGLGAYYVSYVEELDRLFLETIDADRAGSELYNNYRTLVYDLKRGREADGAFTYYLTESLLVRWGNSFTFLDLEGNEIPELGNASFVSYTGNDIYSSGSVIFNGKGELLAKGEWVSPYYNSGSPLTEKDNYIAVRNEDGDVGVIDLQGKQILPFEYDNIAIGTDCQGLFAVYDGDTVGVLDAKGREVLPFMPAKSGLAYISTEGGLILVYDREADTNAVYNGKGELVIPPCDLWESSLIIGSDYTYYDPDGFVLVNNRSEKLWGAYDREGNLVLPVEYESIDGFCQGRCIVTLQDGSKALVNEKGDYVVEPGEYDSISRLTDGAYAVSRDGSEGVIDGDGKIILPLEYDAVTMALGDYYAVEKDGETAVVDASGKTVVESEPGHIGGYSYYGNYYLSVPADTYGSFVRYFINDGGKVYRTEEEELRIRDEKNGYFLVYVEATSPDEDWRYGVVDANRGELLIDVKYDAVCPCNRYIGDTMCGKYFLVRDGDRVGLVTNPHFEEKPASVRQEEEEAGGFPWVWVGIGVGGAAVVIAVIAVVVAVSRKKKKAKPAAVVPPVPPVTPAPPVTPVPPVTPAAEGPRFCSECGAAVTPGDLFCRECGKKL